MQDNILVGPRSLGIGIVCFTIALGCAPDGSRENPFRVENDALKRQLAKQESLLGALQDGNKVMQQQIDLLNQELRDAKSSMEVTKADAKRLTEQMELQLAETKRMIAAQMAESLKIEEKGAQSDTLPRPMPTVAKVVEDALARNGYHLKVSVKTDQRAVYVTERKVSTPATLEMTGSRNQYLVSLEALPDSVTKLGVKAEFERVAQGGRILSVSHEETSEVERRLISEINKALENPQKT
ncbi:MAG: hypothetical protein A4C66_04220 [Nitrospira sp. HN-bin3]|uniref:hypothetical protein n=1 Tax=Nitrospira cf. moscoviensis SBR1015 TaxID=96242 RepID=UPI000A0C8864|nr:hypothetical protein [Nitrospira cf. moscoviensis SBR1015]MBH0208367.1 hypothetical protein [Nitrospira sp.]OQW32385.1 MAG: hypothetical protein A4C66_04220 [Nitrospira sp. HN-bin3]